MKRLWLIMVLVAGVMVAPSYASEFAGLTPGRSTLADAEKIMGERTPSGGEDVFDGTKFDAREIRIRTDGSGIIQTIRIMPANPPAAVQMRQWLNLPDPIHHTRQTDVTIEFYYPSCIALGVRDGKVTELAYHAPSQVVAQLRAAGSDQVTQKVDAFLADLRGRTRREVDAMQLDKAIVLLSELLLHVPADLEVRESLAQALHEAGRDQQALDLLSISSLVLVPGITDMQLDQLMRDQMVHPLGILERLVKATLEVRRFPRFGARFKDRVVTRVQADSPATRATPVPPFTAENGPGLQVGDRIDALVQVGDPWDDKQTIYGWRDGDVGYGLFTLARITPGKPYHAVVRRQGKPLMLEFPHMAYPPQESSSWLGVAGGMVIHDLSWAYGAATIAWRGGGGEEARQRMLRYRKAFELRQQALAAERSMMSSENTDAQKRKLAAQALARWQELLAMIPDSPEATAGSAMVLAEIGHFEKADALLADVLNWSSCDARSKAMLLRAAVLERGLKDPRAAAAFLKKAVTQPPTELDLARLRYMLAEAVQKYDPAQAIDLWRQYLKDSRRVPGQEVQRARAESIIHAHE